MRPIPQRQHRQPRRQFAQNLPIVLHPRCQLEHPSDIFLIRPTHPPQPGTPTKAVRHGRAAKRDVRDQGIQVPTQGHPIRRILLNPPKPFHSVGAKIRRTRPTHPHIVPTALQPTHAVQPPRPPIRPRTPRYPTDPPSHQQHAHQNHADDQPDEPPVVPQQPKHRPSLPPGYRRSRFPRTLLRTRRLSHRRVACSQPAPPQASIDRSFIPAGSTAKSPGPRSTSTPPPPN